MTDKNKRSLTGLLGLCKRAGKLICGADHISDALRTNQVKLVLLADDASDNTKKRLTDHCTFYNVKYFSDVLDSEGLGRCIGEKGNVAAVAITDKGFKTAIEKLFSD